MNGPFMVFDVESVGLHGEGFAVGFVVVESNGKEIDSGRASTNWQRAKRCKFGWKDDQKWIAQNIPEFENGHLSAQRVRQSFWKKWCEWKKHGALLVADCGWPVEARFLIQCVEDMLPTRKWEGPYPFHELASFMVAAGLDPKGKYQRLPRELPEHDPLSDARQSARILTHCLALLSKRETAGLAC